ncbi:hypothetical protein GCM10007063_16590 [Lentibacillus kapialis]|uniref:YwqI/YxiC family protein n=1 Tax=Lentibacillus kapialis TaxID=340214 RepID=A0A917PWC9_9BACI|nr:DUF5344 family protein [Lentibacillus kapialis]GGJ94736.1 hypothetical protein GCM10007063_16590 [Lentibacillus kapialis]
MSDEIKLKDSPVQQSLNELKNTVEAMETAFSKHTLGDNSMDVADKLQQMKQQLENINVSYQAVLRENTESANHVIESLKETDETVASSFQVLK